MQISLIDANQTRLEELVESFRDLPMVSMVFVPQAIYNKPPGGLDCIFLTLPAAERWRPDYRSRQAQILKTSETDKEKGFPPLIATGVNLVETDPKDPASQVKIVLESTFAAINCHNEQSSVKIYNCGFWVMDLTRGISTAQFVDLLRNMLLRNKEQYLDNQK